ncbi:MAG: 1,4-dihydroxy-2-naphthoate polyprenyltransferase [Bacillus sp. (in: firmicutes)]
MQTQQNTEPVALPADRHHWKVWWRLTRPHTLTAAFVPVLIGTAVAILEQPINIWLFLAMLLASLLIQAATNMFNEYYDFKNGLDNEHSVGIGGAIVRHGVTPEKVMKIALSLYGIAILLGLYICAATSWWLAAVGTISMLVGYLYTGGPYPISRTPFGELVSGFFMGMLIILIAFYVQTGTITPDAVLISVPIMILVGAILLSNSIRDLEEDTGNGRRTLAILLGREKAIMFLAAMFTVSYAWLLILIIMDVVSPWTLLAYLSIPKPIKAVTLFKSNDTPIGMVPAMRATAQTNTIFGFLMAIGLFISYFA